MSAVDTIDVAAYRKLLAAGQGVKARGRARAPRAGDMNGTEEAYAAHLEMLRLAGAIARWDFQPEKLRLAKRTYFDPDFRVLAADGSLQYHEVKGHMEDDAAVKLKVAAELHPYAFFLVKRTRGGWAVTEVTP